MTCKELTLNGLKYQDEETGEHKNIPRFEDDSGYKYSDKDKEIKDALFLYLCRYTYSLNHLQSVECFCFLPFLRLGILIHLKLILCNSYYIIYR